MTTDDKDKVDIETNMKTIMKPQKRYGLILAIVIVALGVLAINTFSISGDSPNIDKNKWQAVFLINNQVYFGHLKNAGEEQVALEDVFYLRVDQPIQGPATNPPPLSLVKLGGELHGPEDRMYIAKANMLFWESMRDDSQVVQAINNFLKQQSEQ